MVKPNLILVLIVFASVPVFGHSGGLDQNGGHHDHKNGGYHYHRHNSQAGADYSRTFGGSRNYGRGPIEFRNPYAASLPKKPNKTAPRVGTETFKATVVDAIDGDTLDVKTDAGDWYLVRLAGVSAPKLDQELGTEIRDEIARVLKGKMVSVIPKGVDKLRRVHAVVIFKEHSVNEWLVEAGAARWNEKQAPNKTNLDAAQQSAKANKRGIWSANSLQP